MKTPSLADLLETASGPYVQVDDDRIISEFIVEIGMAGVFNPAGDRPEFVQVFDWANHSIFWLAIAKFSNFPAEFDNGYKAIGLRKSLFTHDRARNVFRKLLAEVFPDTTQVYQHTYNRDAQVAKN